MSKFSEAQRKRALDRVGDPPVSKLKFALQVVAMIVWVVVMFELTVHILK